MEEEFVISLPATIKVTASQAYEDEGEVLVEVDGYPLNVMPVEFSYLSNLRKRSGQPEGDLNLFALLELAEEAAWRAAKDDVY